MSKPSVVLVVESSPALGKGVVTALENHGYATLLATTTKAAFATLERGHVDLVIVDVTLPPVGGRDLLRGVANTTRPIPMIGVGAVSQDTSGLMVAEYSLADFVIKPFGFPTLVASVSRVLG
ncbi:MAG: response regulator [Myxococcales bacterium]|nr:response regulator [Myxococcales bacterium]